MKNSRKQTSTISADMLEALRDRYDQFDAALKFAKRHRLPNCKCEVLAMPSHCSHEAESYGYTASVEHVAAVICAVLEDEAQGEEQWDVGDLNILREDGTVYLRLEHWDLVWFRPLTNYEIRRVRAEYRKARRWRVRDPFEFEPDLYPYMANGEWQPVEVRRPEEQADEPEC